ncbi:MAG: Veg family protein [Clostridia bacterium]|nr:Veg family protein [Clostridia bacterium]
MENKGGIWVIEKADIERVKALLTENNGKRIKLSAKKGRKRIIVRHGVIKETYPSIFLVTLDSISDFAVTERTVSFSYADILTKSVEIMLADTKQIIM